MTLAGLHIHSVWETICDARASRVWRAAWQNLYSFCQEIPILILNTQEYPLSPPPQKIEIRPEVGTLSFDYPRITPPPGKLKFGQKLALWVLTTQEYPLPPEIEIWPEVGTEFWKGLQLECVETNRCIPQGNRLVGFLDNGTGTCLALGATKIRQASPWLKADPSKNEIWNSKPFGKIRHGFLDSLTLNLECCWSLNSVTIWNTIQNYIELQISITRQSQVQKQLC